MRDSLKRQFLDRLFIENYQITDLPMDASLRSYSRVSTIDKSFILMDCPPEYTGVLDFLNVAKLLRDNALQSPEIFHTDSVNGFILMEDFGDVTFQKFILSKQFSLNEIYRNIIDVLVQVQKIETHNLQHHTIDILLSGLEVSAKWYLGISGDKKESYIKFWRDALSSLPDLGKVVVLRDFHVENLMSLDDSSQKIGLLDFQDAVLGSPAYDLVSLLQDARLDVPDDLETEMIDYYLSLNPNIDCKDFLYSYNLLGAQRNSRILGVFNRKINQDKREKYIAFLPVVKRYLDKNIKALGLVHLDFLITKTDC